MRGWSDLPCFTRLNRGRETVSAAVVALAVCWLGGCATKEANPQPTRPGSGVAEYRELTSEARAAMLAALQSLDEVGSQPTPCPPKVIAAFAGQVQRLQVDSLRVRARAQAIQARGDAYFADWSENIARIKDPQVRAQAQRFHPELEQCFSRIKLASWEAGAVFKSFLSGLRLIRVRLETQTAPAEAESTRDLIRASREHGAEVLRQLRAVDDELAAVTRLLTPSKAVAKK